MSEPMINESGNDTSITAIPSASNSQDIMTNYSSQSITKVLDANISGIKNGSSSRNATRPPNTFQGASFLSRILFLWPYDLIQRGQRLHRPITEMDLPQVLKEDSSNYNLGIIEQLWEYEQKRSSKNKQRPNLHRALLYHYISTMWDTTKNRHKSYSCLTYGGSLFLSELLKAIFKLINYLPSQKAISKSKREPVQNRGGNRESEPRLGPQIKNEQRRGLLYFVRYWDNSWSFLVLSSSFFKIAAIPL